MTPFERAVDTVKSGPLCLWLDLHREQEIINQLTTAFQAQSNEDELRHRDLVAQQAQRADEAVARLAQYGSHGHKCCHGQCVDVGPNGPEYNMGCDCGLLDAINEGYPGIAADFEQEKALRRAEWHRANDAEAQRDAALAHAAEMRRALERNRQGLLNIIEMRQMTNGRYGNLTKEEIFESIMEIEAALSLSPGEALAGQAATMLSLRNRLKDVQGALADEDYDEARTRLSAVVDELPAALPPGEAKTGGDHE